MPTLASHNQTLHVFFSYWYSALGLLVTEMKSGTVTAGIKDDASGGVAGSSRNRGTLVAASLGGAKRSASLCFLDWCLGRILRQ